VVLAAVKAGYEESSGHELTFPLLLPATSVDEGASTGNTIALVS